MATAFIISNGAIGAKRESKNIRPLLGPANQKTQNNSGRLLFRSQWCHKVYDPVNVFISRWSNEKLENHIVYWLLLYILNVDLLLFMRVRFFLFANNDSSKNTTLNN